MILIEATIKYAGYDPRELKKWSNKRVCRVCDGCSRVGWCRFSDYRDLCQICANQTDEHRRKISKAMKGVPKTTDHRKRIGDGNRGKIISDETRSNVSKAMKGKKRAPFTDEHLSNMSKAQKGKKKPPLTDECRQHMSATYQGIPYEEWTKFITQKPYCEKFDEACRERVRTKYDYKCFICDRPQDQNITKSGKVRKLSVHHVDSNKDQGCNGHEWKLVPLCMRCHRGTHHEPMKSRIEYLLSIEDV